MAEVVRFLLKEPGFSAGTRNILGVNAGPIYYAGNQRGRFSDRTADAYATIHVRAVRTHDLYGPCDLDSFVPNLETASSVSALEYRPARLLDVLQEIVSLRMEPYLRIGYSLERPQGNHPRRIREGGQQELVAAAAVRMVEEALEVVRSGRLHVEIWNEPDLHIFWPYNDGTRDGLVDSFDDFIALYRRIARAVREVGGERVRIGGPGFTSAAHQKINHIEPSPSAVERFVKGIEDSPDVPLDFLSWHLYLGMHAEDIGGFDAADEFCSAAKKFRKKMKGTCHADVPFHITEWSVAEKLRGQLATARASSKLTIMWITMFREGVERAFFYRGHVNAWHTDQEDGEPRDSDNRDGRSGTALIDAFGEVTTIGWAFRLWSYLWAIGTGEGGKFCIPEYYDPTFNGIGLYPAGGGPGVVALGARNDVCSAVLLTNDTGQDFVYRFAFERDNGGLVPSELVYVKRIASNGSTSDYLPDTENLWLKEGATHLALLSKEALRTGVRTDPAHCLPDPYRPPRATVS